MDEDIAAGLPRRPPGRRGGGYCCRMVGSDPLVAVPAAGFVAAAHNLVLAAGGAVYSFGHNGHGRLGLGDAANRFEPTEIEALRGAGVHAICGGGQCSLAASRDKVYGFGRVASFTPDLSGDALTPAPLEVCVRAL